MRVLTYNIHGWRTTDGRPNLNAVCEVIGQTKADIVGLNEVFFPCVVEGDTAPALEALAQRLGMHFVFGPCLRWPAQDDMPADAYGNALLSRWPIIANATHHLTPVADKEQRGLLEGRILLPDNQTFTVYVTHLDHTDEQARATQSRALRTWTVRDRSRPHVVMGDFNAIGEWDLAGRQGASAQLARHPQTSHLVDDDNGPQVIAQMEKAGYIDAYRLHGEPGVPSFIPATDLPMRIDYIFVSKPLEDAIDACWIWQEPDGQEASDHRPVLAEIRLAQESV